MKRIVIFSVLTAGLFFETARAGILGDFNDDGELNISDVITLLLKARENPAQPGLDFNADGQFSIVDAVALVLYIINIDTREQFEFSDVALTNHTGTAFALSWRTSSPTSNNAVLYGYDKQKLDRIVVDHTSQNQPSRIHFVQLVFLDPDTTCYYRIRSEGVEYSGSPSGVDSAATFPQAFSHSSLLLEGQIVDQAGQSLERMLVRSYLELGGETTADSSMWIAHLTDSEGKFWSELANYRGYDGSPISHNYSPNQTWLHVQILGPEQGVVEYTVLLTALPNDFQQLGTFTLP
ncbi:fibronectin type III domain-containing protein [Gemmatimonadota bacterium]